MPHIPRRWSHLLAAVGTALVMLVSGCASGGAEEEATPAPPELRQCRLLTPEDLTAPSNDDEAVPCQRPHTAETYAVGSFPERFASADRADPQVEGYAYATCATKLQTFLGADESLVMRSIISWAWFRPSQTAWEQGERWYRCDAVGGSASQNELVRLPRTAKGLMLGQPRDKWLVCADGASFDSATKVPCSKPHDWRAASTIKLGQPDDPYPGDTDVQVRTSDYCEQSIDAFLGYPDDFDFAFTWFKEPEWMTGNRRSVCWARTDR